VFVCVCERVCVHGAAKASKLLIGTH
jgi:hypothetical protein